MDYAWQVVNKAASGAKTHLLSRLHPRLKFEMRGNQPVLPKLLLGPWCTPPAELGSNGRRATDECTPHFGSFFETNWTRKPMHKGALVRYAPVGWSQLVVLFLALKASRGNNAVIMTGLRFSLGGWRPLQYPANEGWILYSIQ